MRSSFAILLLVTCLSFLHSCLFKEAHRQKTKHSTYPESQSLAGIEAEEHTEENEKYNHTEKTASDSANTSDDNFHGKVQAELDALRKNSWHLSKKIFSPLEPQTLSLSHYITLQVPKNAFLYKDGKPVKDSVIIYCKDYEQMGTVFLDGIPMLALEQGEKVQIQSGGMFGLSAYTKDSTPVMLDPGKGAEITFWGSEEGPFDIYKLKEDSSSWTNLTKTYPVRDSDCQQKDGLKINFDTTGYPENHILNDINWQMVQTGNPLYDKSQKELQGLSFTNIKIEKAKKAPALMGSYPANMKRSYNSAIKLRDKQGVVFKNPDFTALHVHKLDGTEMVRLTEEEFGRSAMLREDDVVLFPNHKALFMQSMDKVFLLSWGDKPSKILYSQDKKTANKCFVTSSSTLVVTKFSSSWGTKGNKRFHTDSRTIWVLDHEGKILKKLNYEGRLGYDFAISEDASEFMYRVEDELVFIDALGNEQGRYSKNKRFGKSMPRYTEQKDIFLFSDSLNNLHIWDRSKDLMIRHPDFEWAAFTKDFSIQRIPEKKPVLMVSSKNKLILWNWESQKIQILDDFIGIPFFAMDGKYIGAFTFRGASSFLINTETMDTLSIGGWNNGRRASDITFNSGNNRYILTGTGLGLYEGDNRLIKNLRDTDNSIRVAEFESGSNRFITINRNDIIRIHDSKGEVLHKFGGHELLYRTWLDGKYVKSYTSTSKGKQLKVLDFEGNLAGYFYDHQEAVVSSSEPYAAFSRKGIDTLHFLKLEAVPLPDSSYLLTLINHRDSFRMEMYIQISGCSYQKYLEYLEVRKEQIRKEEERSDEYRDVRHTLQINSLGIYNWDIAYDQKGRMYCQLQTPFDTAYSDLTKLKFLQVCGPSMNTLFEYYPGTLNEFSWNPEERNVLLTILPGNKIAIMHPHEFEKLSGSQNKPGTLQGGKFEIYDSEPTPQFLNYLIQKDVK